MSDGWGVKEAINGDDVESGGPFEPTFGFHKGLGSADNALLLGAVDGFFGPGVGIGPAAANFDKNKLSAMASNQIDLGWAGVDVAGQNAQALFFEEFLG